MSTSYILIDYNMAPDVFKKVIEVKKMLASGKLKSVGKALDSVGLSRTAFYKYKNHVFSSADERGDNIATLAFTLEDVTGVLSEILLCLANNKISVLTINQNIPVNGIANVTISLRLNKESVAFEKVEAELKQINGVNKIHLLAMN